MERAEKSWGPTKNNVFFNLVIIFSGDQQRKINTEHKMKVNVDVKLNETNRNGGKILMGRVKKKFSGLKIGHYCEARLHGFEWSFPRLTAGAAGEQSERRVGCSPLMFRYII